MSIVRKSITFDASLADSYEEGLALYKGLKGIKGRTDVSAWNALVSHCPTVFALLAGGQIERVADLAWKANADVGIFVDRLLDGATDSAVADARDETILERLNALAQEADLSADAFLDELLAARPATLPANVSAHLDDHKRVHGTARLRIERAVNELMAEGWAVTAGTIFKRSGSNRQTINAWLESHSRQIANYHELAGIGDPTHHNMMKGRGTV